MRLCGANPANSVVIPQRLYWGLLFQAELLNIPKYYCPVLWFCFNRAHWLTVFELTFSTWDKRYPPLQSALKWLCDNFHLTIDWKNKYTSKPLSCYFPWGKLRLAWLPLEGSLFSGGRYCRDSLATTIYWPYFLCVDTFGYLYFKIFLLYFGIRRIFHNDQQWFKIWKLTKNFFHNFTKFGEN